jgi:hypothetical protein
MKKFYNCFKDNKGYLIPKSVVIKNNPEIIKWLSTEFKVSLLFNDKPDSLNLDKEWLYIGIGHSWKGYIYMHVSSSTNEYVDKYLIDNPYMKIFDEDYEAFMKYMNWVAKLVPWFTKQRFKNED